MGKFQELIQILKTHLAFGRTESAITMFSAGKIQTYCFGGPAYSREDKGQHFQCLKTAVANLPADSGAELLPWKRFISAGELKDIVAFLQQQEQKGQKKKKGRSEAWKEIPADIGHDAANFRSACIEAAKDTQFETSVQISPELLTVCRSLADHCEARLLGGLNLVVIEFGWEPQPLCWTFTTCGHAVRLYGPSFQQLRDGHPKAPNRCLLPVAVFDLIPDSERRRVCVQALRVPGETTINTQVTIDGNHLWELTYWREATVGVFTQPWTEMRKEKRNVFTTAMQEHRQCAVTIPADRFLSAVTTPKRYTLVRTAAYKPVVHLFLNSDDWKLTAHDAMQNTGIKCVSNGFGEYSYLSINGAAWCYMGARALYRDRYSMLRISRWGEGIENPMSFELLPAPGNETTQAHYTVLATDYNDCFEKQRTDSLTLGIRGEDHRIDRVMETMTTVTGNLWQLRVVLENMPYWNCAPYSFAGRRFVYWRSRFWWEFEKQSWICLTGYEFFRLLHPSSGGTVIPASVQERERFGAFSGIRVVLRPADEYGMHRIRIWDAYGKELRLTRHISVEALQELNAWGASW